MAQICKGQDDPYARLKQAVAGKPVVKVKNNAKTFSMADNPNYKLYPKPPIPFKPFPLIDKDDKSIPPEPDHHFKKWAKNESPGLFE